MSLNKEKRLQIRCTEDQKARWESAARLAEKSLSEWVCEQLDGSQVTMLDPDDSQFKTLTTIPIIASDEVIDDVDLEEPVAAVAPDTRTAEAAALPNVIEESVAPKRQWGQGKPKKEKKEREVKCDHGRTKAQYCPVCDKK